MGDAYRHSLLPPLHTHKWPLVYSLNKLSAVSLHLIGLLSSCLSAQVAEHAEAADIYVTNISLLLNSSHVLSRMCTEDLLLSLESSWQTYHCLAVSRVTMETQHQVRDCCS